MTHEPGTPSKALMPVVININTGPALHVDQYIVTLHVDHLLFIQYTWTNDQSAPGIIRAYTPSQQFTHSISTSCLCFHSFSQTSTHVKMLQKRHDADNRRPEVETVIISFLALSWVTVLARCWVRIRMIKAFAVDDWLTVLTLQLFTIYSAWVLVGTHWGCGRHVHDLTIKQRVNSMHVSCTRFANGSTANN